MRVYRILVLALVALGAVFAAPGAANALTYPPPNVSAPGRATVGDTVPFIGNGFLPNSSLTVSLSYSATNAPAGLRADQSGQVVLAGLRVPQAVVGTVVVNSSGGFSTTVTLTRVGLATLTATGLDANGLPVSLSATIVVVPAAEPNGRSPRPHLPVTGMSGGNLAMQVATGVGAIVAGAVTIWLTAIWRRRSAHRV